MFVIKINWDKSTIVVSDVNIAANEFIVKGFAATSTSGAQPTKFGWFKLKDLNAHSSPEIIKSITDSFAVGSPLDELEFGELLDAERRMFMVSSKK